MRYIMVIVLKEKKFQNFTSGHSGLQPVAVVKKTKICHFIGHKFAVYEKFRLQLIS